MNTCRLRPYNITKKKLITGSLLQDRKYKHQLFVKIYAKSCFVARRLNAFQDAAQGLEG